MLLVPNNIVYEAAQGPSGDFTVVKELDYPLISIELQNKAYAIEMAEHYKIPLKSYLDTIHCESRWNITALGDGGKAYGLAQFHEPTFNQFRDESGLDVHYDSAKGQLELMAWAFREGYQRHWTCYGMVT